jgi:hypothetical protein
MRDTTSPVKLREWRASCAHRLEIISLDLSQKGMSVIGIFEDIEATLALDERGYSVFTKCL